MVSFGLVCVAFAEAPQGYNYNKVNHPSHLYGYPTNKDFGPGGAGSAFSQTPIFQMVTVGYYSRGVTNEFAGAGPQGAASNKHETIFGVPEWRQNPTSPRDNTDDRNSQTVNLKGSSLEQLLAKLLAQHPFSGATDEKHPHFLALKWSFKDVTNEIGRNPFMDIPFPSIPDIPVPTGKNPHPHPQPTGKPTKPTGPNNPHFVAEIPPPTQNPWSNGWPNHPVHPVSNPQPNPFVGPHYITPQSSPVPSNLFKLIPFSEQDRIGYKK